jgi:hypothetical protein
MHLSVEGSQDMKAYLLSTQAFIERERERDLLGPRRESRDQRPCLQLRIPPPDTRLGGRAQEEHEGPSPPIRAGVNATQRPGSRRCAGWSTSGSERKWRGPGSRRGR